MLYPDVYEPLDWTTQEYRALVRMTMNRAFTERKADDLHPYRIRAVHRVMRNYLVITNKLDYSEPLHDYTDSWALPILVPPTKMHVQFGGGQLGRQMQLANTLHTTLQPRIATDNGMETRRGIPLSPPEIAEAFWNEPTPTDPHPTIKESYDPKDDAALQQWLVAMRDVAHSVGLDDDESLFGAYGVFHYSGRWARELFPTASEILEWDYLITKQMLEWMKTEGIITAEDLAREQFDLNRAEIVGLVRNARTLAKFMMDGETEDDKALQLLRLEDFLKRARSALDMKAEMGALKQIAIVTGLTRTKEDDAMKDFMKVVSSAKKASKALTNAAKTINNTPVLTLKPSQPPQITPMNIAEVGTSAG